MGFKRLPIVFLLSLGLSPAWAAPIKVDSDATPRALAETSPYDLNKLTVEALQLPRAQRLSALAQQGVDGYKALREIAFQSHQSMDLRWRAFMAMAMLGKKLSLPELEQGAQHKDWFLRSGALQALSRVAPEKAIIWARRMLDDKALVVRSAAVKVLREQRDVESSRLLWQKLNAKDNFRGGVGLWVRRNMVMALADFAREEDTGRFIDLLNSSDESLHAVAVQGLERITKKKLGQTFEPLSYKRTYWLNWWAENSGQRTVF